MVGSIGDDVRRRRCASTSHGGEGSTRWLMLEMVVFGMMTMMMVGIGTVGAPVGDHDGVVGFERFAMY